MQPCEKARAQRWLIWQPCLGYQGEPGTTSKLYQNYEFHSFKNMVGWSEALQVRRRIIGEGDRWFGWPLKQVLGGPLE